MLLSANTYQSLDAKDLRAHLANGLRDLFFIYHQSDGEIPFLPEKAELESSGRLKKPDKNTNKMQLEMETFPDDIASFYPYAETYMGNKSKKIPKKQRTLEPLIAANTTKKKKKRHKKKKK